MKCALGHAAHVRAQTSVTVRACNTIALGRCGRRTGPGQPRFGYLSTE